MELTTKQKELLRKFTHYIWWQSPEVSLNYPERLIAQVMDLGDWNDECQLMDTFGDDILRSVLSQAEAGWFRPKSWAFWNYRLRIVSFDSEPPNLPRRNFSG